ncbi:MAG: RNA polymerase sigma factor RpoH [Gammaproteobacteria bacterium]|nr:RNA polymerase sigma factor RpoH [Gammaproteobacteria bacterium]
MNQLPQTYTQSALPALSSGSLQAYIDTVHRIPVLSREEEIELFERFQRDNDLEAARRIVLSNLRYVVYIARSYAGYGLPVEDLIQEGNVGLMKSVKRFSLDHEVRLVSFAVHWIRAEIHEFILRNWKIVKIATTKAQRKLFFNLRKAKERLGWFNAEEVQQVASDLGVKPEEVVRMEARLSQMDESLDLPEHDEDAARGPVVYLTRGEEENPFALVAEEEFEETYLAGLERALTSLDQRSRDIVESRWLQEDKASLKTLSEKYGVSIERIRQIESSAFKKMQPFLAAPLIA